MRVSERVLVMWRGEMAGILERDDMNEAAIMQLAVTGGRAP